MTLFFLQKFLKNCLDFGSDVKDLQPQFETLASNQDRDDRVTIKKMQTVFFFPLPDWEAGEVEGEGRWGTLPWNSNSLARCCCYSSWRLHSDTEAKWSDRIAAVAGAAWRESRRRWPARESRRRRASSLGGKRNASWLRIAAAASTSNERRYYPLELNWWWWRMQKKTMNNNETTRRSVAWGSVEEVSVRWGVVDSKTEERPLCFCLQERTFDVRFKIRCRELNLLINTIIMIVNW